MSLSNLRFYLTTGALWLTAAHCTAVNAQYDPEFMEARSVRVIAKGVHRTNAASGFLWQNREQVITSLHAVPSGSEISVECRGVRKRATVLKTLLKADLILLHAPDLPASCTPFMSMEKTKPEPYSPLYTFGYHAGARSGTSRKFEKGHANPEQLDSLITGAPLKAIKELGFPATDLDIYYVQGGLLPGYSGGPVVNQHKQLVGIVDGGLNKGMSSYNWVVPAKYLDELIASNSNSIPQTVAQSTVRHFSTGLDEVDDSTVIRYEQDGVNYTWVHTKTQSLSDLEKTSDDVESIGFFFDDAASAVGLATKHELMFDIFEELTKELIIAIPKGQPLRFERTDEGEEWLASDSLSPEGGYAGTRYSYLTRDIHNDLQQVVSPADPEYFNNLVAKLIIDCYQPGSVICALIPEANRIIDFGNGNKILRFTTVRISGDYNADDFSGEYDTGALDHYSIAVQGDKVFAAQSHIKYEGEVGLLQCADVKSLACQNSTVAREQLAQFLAVSLTSFSGGSRGLENDLVQRDYFYDNRGNRKETMSVEYYDGGELRFFNTRGREWRVYDGVEFEIATEVEGGNADTEGGKYVLLEGAEEFRILVPIAGGDYFVSQGKSPWNRMGELQRHFEVQMGFFTD